MRILFLTQRLPYAPNRGDRIRAYHLLALLRTLGNVDLVSFVHDAEEERQLPTIDGLSSVRAVRLTRARNHLAALPALLGSVPLTHLLLYSPRMRAALEDAAAHRPDVVLAVGSGMARFCLEPPLRGIPFVVDMVDADSKKWEELAERSAPPLRWIYRREARCLSRFERRVTAAAAGTAVVNERELDVLRNVAPDGEIVAIPVGVDVARMHASGPPVPSGDVVFCGVMNYPPNEEGAVWLVSEVWPLVRRRRPDARLLLVGSKPSRRVKALADPGRGVIVTGTVSAVEPYLWAAAVSAAPLFTARGVQTKVLESVAAGLPTVVTSAVAKGLPAEIMPACIVADQVDAFAHVLLELLAMTPEQRRLLAEKADLSALSWEAGLAPFRAILNRAAGRTLR